MATHFLVLGATGACGVDFCNYALSKEHRLTLYVRSPNKLPESISSHPSVTIIQGDLTNRDGLEKAAGCGATVLVSFIGPMPRAKGTPIFDGFKLLWPLLVEKRTITRALVLSAPSYSDSAHDRFSLFWSAAATTIRTLVPNVYRDLVAYTSFVASQPTDDIAWTVFRVVFLTKGQEREAKAAWKGSGNDGARLSRKALSAWVLEEVEARQWVGLTPIVSNR